MWAKLTIAFLLILVACNGNQKQAEAFNNQGVELLDKEEYPKALQQFRKALNVEGIEASMIAGICRNISLAYSAQGEVDSAIVYATRAIDHSSPQSFEYFLNKGEKAVLTKNIAQAVEHFEQAKALEANQMAPYNSLGMIYSGKYGEAFTDYGKALDNNKKAYEIAPRDPLAEALALSYMNTDQYAESLTYWRIVRKSQPANMEYLFQEGVALYFSGDEETGEQQMREAAERDENCRRMLNEMMQE